MHTTLSFQLPDGVTCVYPQGTSFQQIASDFQPQFNSPILAVKWNRIIQDLRTVPPSGGELRFIDLNSEDGVRIYARSLFLVLVRVVEELFPGCTVRVEHSLSKGLYGEIHCLKQPLTEREVQTITARMREIIAADEPIHRKRIPLEQAQAVFRDTGRLDTLDLFQNYPGDEVEITKCGNCVDYLNGITAPSTGSLKVFNLKYHLPGFILQFPTTDHPVGIPVFQENRKLAGIFYEFEKWAEILEVSEVGSLNSLVSSGIGEELIRIAEALHEKKIAHIADHITANREKVRIILVAGPSASGKTTFAQRLSVQLRVNGLRPVAISTDDFFVDRELTPLGSDGEPDYEALSAVDLELFNETLAALIQGYPIHLPRYNFHAGKREQRAEETRLTPNQPIIIEGIHGLNNKLTASIPKDNKYKIYISALSQLNLDHHNRIPTTDNRILRRLVRDYRSRGYDAAWTLGIWPKVRRGEDLYIFPFQEEADVMFNSALIYELAVLKRHAEPLLEGIASDSSQYAEALRLRELLKFFQPLGETEVPLNSILREFIGNSCFR